MIRRCLVFGLLVALSAEALTSCARRPGKVVYRGVGPEYLVEKIQENRRRMQSLDAALKIWVTKGKRRSLDAWLIYRWPDQYRLEVWGPLGTSLMSLRAEGDEFLAYIPSTNEVVEGSLRSLPQIFDIDADYSSLASAIIGFPDLDQSWLVDLTDYQIMEDGYLLEFKRWDQVRRFWLDPRTLMVVREERSEGYVIRYGGYERSSDVWRPQNIEIAIDAGLEKVRVTFENQRINIPIPPENFHIRFPQGAARIIVD